MDIRNYPAQEPENFEDFGELQYIIDRLPDNEKFIVTQYFVHNWTKTRIALWLVGKSVKVVARILRNLQRIDLTGDEPMITFRGKTFALRGLNECNY